MRFAAYAGTSAVLAAGVVLRAFHERPNFYSAAVYLSQSNACLMILTNLVLLLAFGLLFGLQRLLYGPLRPIEIEQLYEKAWFAVTETCLAMTIFREDIGAWFLVMFVSLLAGKVWGWIGEGRVEILEQQPPANPRLFHVRLTISLLLSVAFSMFMLNFCTSTVLEEARPGMMVMFAFEFAVLTITSTSTVLRYSISLKETQTIHEQTQARLEERRAELRAARERARLENGGDERNAPEVTAEDDIDENDVDVPGWEDKGRWIFYLDLGTDLVKLIIYMAFFSILLAFNGLPIHILRDVFMTARSFVKRLHDFVRYRNATRDMNARYPDARAEDLSRENTCIICREEMRPWEQTGGQGMPQEGEQRPRVQLDERHRPKKLPCGHVLHFACLRSWLERQQVCPTCRRSVLVPNAANARTQSAENAAAPRPPQGNQAAPAGNPPRPNPGAADLNGMRVFNLGPLRITFGAWPVNPRQNVADQVRAVQAGLAQINAPPQAIAADPAHSQRATFTSSSAMLQFRLTQIERQIVQEMQNLQSTQEQLTVIRTLQAELARLRAAQSRSLGDGQPGQSHQLSSSQTPYSPPANFSNTLGQLPYHPIPQVLFPSPTQQSMGTDHPNLPEGVTLPPGWTILPLQRVGPASAPMGNTNPTLNVSTSAHLASAAVPVHEHHSHAFSPPSTSSISVPEGLSTSARDPAPNGNITQAGTAHSSRGDSQPSNHALDVPATAFPSAAESSSHSTLPAAAARSDASWTADSLPEQRVQANGNVESSKASGSPIMNGTDDSPSQPAEQVGMQEKGKSRAATVDDAVD